MNRPIADGCSVVLVSAQTAPGPDAVPLGAASVASALKAWPALAGRVAVHLVDSPRADLGVLDGIEASIRGKAPDVVGFSVYLWNRPLMRELARRLRSWDNPPVMCAGGPEAGADPARLRQELGLDFLVAGEGEESMAQAVGAVADALAAGRNPREAVGTAVAEEMGAPSACPPSPWLDGTLEPGGRPGVLWELTRGCPFACTFCYESRGRRGLRPVPMERLRAELELFRSAGVPQIFVLDPTFNAKRQRALDLLRLIGDRDWGCHWRFEVRAEFLDREQAAAFARLNCSVQIGLQSAHPAVLARVSRNLDRADFARRIAWLNEAGVVFGFDLIYGLPGDSLAGFRQSLDWTLALQPNHLDVFGLSVLPGTRLWEDAPGFGLDWDPDPPYAVRSGPGFPTADMAAAAALARAVDVFYNRGRAVPWFLPVAKALGRKPAAFLQEFAVWLGANGPETHRAIEELQVGFIQSRLTGGQGPEGGVLAEVLRDIVRLNGAWSRAFAEGESTDLELSFDPDRLMGPESLDPRRMARAAGPGRWAVRVEPKGRGVALTRRRPGGRR